MKKISLFLLALVCSVSMFGLEVTYDFTLNYPTGFPTSNKSTGSTATTEAEWTFEGNTIGIHTANSGYLYRSNYAGTYSLFVGKNVKYNAATANTIDATAYIKIPGKVGYRITKVVAKNAANAATSGISLAVCNNSYELVADAVASTTTGDREMTFSIYATAGSETLAENEAAYFCVAPTIASGKNMNIEKFVVTYSPVINLGAAGLATFSADYIFTVTGATAYKAAVSGTDINLTALEGAIPANTAVILKGEADATATIYKAATAAADVTGNELVGTASATHTVAVGEYIYCLTKGSNEFNQVAEGVEIPLNKAYFSLSGVPAAPLRVSLPEEVATGVENVTTVKATKALVNGQLVIVKNGQKFNVNGMLVK